ncbi:thermonuclease family protein [Sphaerospermopsis torques-reginae]|uniref:Thermonuclease family protein n=1 Tax=Sphaerospermopsis torques-reginae ITEP-024 TaxID=984208 RepID=A0ABX8WX92_9CYAN|nr:thermonuclease family protein [Sphaerospermopsis torques-reginae]QYX30766.1 thermonuclease family protein [Sphaerospermopsis torques-reginae ITEP-024]
MKIVPRCSYLQAKIAALVSCLGMWAQKVAILSCLLLLVSCQGKNQPANIITEVKLARVVSGQTLEVLGLGEQPNITSQVRLIGLDAPDLRQRPWGEDAKALLENLIGDSEKTGKTEQPEQPEQPEKTIKLEFDLETKDKFGRTLAYVWKDQVFLNEQVLKQGYALFIGRSPNHKYDERLENAQHWARLMGQGIWNPENPMRQTPGEYRRMNR